MVQKLTADIRKRQSFDRLCLVHKNKQLIFYSEVNSLVIPSLLIFDPKVVEGIFKAWAAPPMPDTLPLQCRST